MRAKIYQCADPAQPDAWEAGLQAAASALSAGELVVLPTDTLYGLGADAFNNAAVAKLLAAKHRGPDMPVPVLVGSWDTISGLVASYSTTARTLVEAFWPGGLSLVVPQAPSLPWNLGDTRGTVMLRMPAHPVAIELLRRVGPMAVSSANISGQAPATTVAAAVEQLGDTVEVYLDGGDSPVGEPSTIIDLSGPRPYLLREGALRAEELAAVLSDEVTADSLRTRPGA